MTASILRVSLTFQKGLNYNFKNYINNKNSNGYFSHFLQNKLFLSIIIILLLGGFSYQLTLIVFYWSFSDSKSPQISRTLPGILVDLNNAVVWMDSIRLLFSKSSSPFINPSVTVPRPPITIGITVTFTFQSIFNSLTRSRYLSFFSFPFNFTLRSAGTEKSTILQILFFIS